MKVRLDAQRHPEPGRNSTLQRNFLERKRLAQYDQAYRLLAAHFWRILANTGGFYALLRIHSTPPAL
jgi:hypothetical protein